ncbi:hypothetical protein E2C01_044853 [Portunus trituberculatus]|uniref:Uncharacterized protein n=1 Tax=Portunus trituberculatus TaxID=210409 RepID=A0A5B7FZG1_PORTR|nr:hypothetical protein [Portunus trituberculatus]
MNTPVSHCLLLWLREVETSRRREGRREGPSCQLPPHGSSLSKGTFFCSFTISTLHFNISDSSAVLMLVTVAGIPAHSQQTSAASSRLATAYTIRRTDDSTQTFLRVGSPASTRSLTVALQVCG